MQRLINFLRGTVTLEAEGPFPERCFNICAAEGVGFWGAQQVDETRVRFTVARWDRKRAAALAERAMCTVRVVEQGGLPALLWQLRRRYGLLAGLAVLLALISVLSRFVLVVEVTGNETVSSSRILAVLQEHGFGVGSYGPEVDVRDLSNQVLLEMEELSFLTINLSGIRAEVIVREARPTPEVVDEDQLTEVVAARDGIVVDVDAIRGRETVQAGQAVLEGEVLISSMLLQESPDGSGEIISRRQVRAEGEVWALTRRVLSAATPLSALRAAGEEPDWSGWGLNFLGRRLNFYGDGSKPDTGCDKIAILYPVTLPGGLALPFGLWQVTGRAYAPAAVDADAAERWLRTRLDERLTAGLTGGEVLARDWQVTRTEDTVTVTLTAQCLEQIGRTVVLTE